ncbi:hypothetical protein Ccr29_gp067 [Caulobacter phage Ccr29]|nr:hypothetical protein Ccr29_gp067 [Caulobacter phage Ccr29]
MTETRTRIAKAVHTLVKVLTAPDVPDELTKKLVLADIKRARWELQEIEQICQQEIAGG